jgi:N-acyl-L-homoserine lactone synthetase
VNISLPFRPGLTLQGINPISSTPPSLQTRLITHDDPATEDIFRLRYDSYNQAGYLPSNTSGKWSDEFDHLASTFHLAVVENDRYRGAIRISFSETEMIGDTLPCEPYFPEVAALRRQVAGPIVEIGRMALDPTIQNTSFRATNYGALVRSAILVCMACDVEMLLAGAHPKWQKFYERILGFAVTGEPKTYPPGTQKITLLARAMGTTSPARFGLNPFFRIDHRDEQAVRAKLAPLLVWRRSPFSKPYRPSPNA